MANLHLGVLAALLLTVAACSNAEILPDATYGEVLSDAEPVPVEAVLSEPALFIGQRVTVAGTIHQVCQMAGCWLTLRAADHHADLMVQVDRTESGAYTFTVPQDISGRYAVAEGILEHADGAHSAHLEDDGMESVPTLSVQATGVRVFPEITD